MLPLSSDVRRRKQACSFGLVTPRSGPASGEQTSALRCGCPVGAKCQGVVSRPSCCIIAFAPPGLPAGASSVRRRQPISRAVSSGHAASGVSDSLTIRSSGRPNRFAFGPPLSSRVRRWCFSWSEASSVSASRDSWRRDIRPARAVRVRVASPLGCKVAGVGSRHARAPTTAIRPCLLVLAPAHFRLTSHSSGPINRFAIDVAD